MGDGDATAPADAQYFFVPTVSLRMARSASASGLGCSSSVGAASADAGAAFSFLGFFSFFALGGRSFFGGFSFFGRSFFAFFSFASSSVVAEIGARRQRPANAARSNGAFESSAAAPSANARRSIIETTGARRRRRRGHPEGRNEGRGRAEEAHHLGPERNCSLMVPPEPRSSSGAVARSNDVNGGSSMQTPPTNDRAARAAAVKARWKRAVRAVQEPLTPSVAEEFPPRPPLVRSHAFCALSCGLWAGWLD